MMTDTLKIQNLSLSFGPNEVLNIENMNIQANTITALLGPSGSGKSTLFNAILRNKISPSYIESGQILLENQELTKNVVEDYVAVISQKARLYTGTIRENLMDGSVFQSNNKEREFRFIRAFLKQLGIWEYFKDIVDSPAIKQSLGIHKLLLIARAMMVKPKLLLVDEVLANTSVKDEALIMNIIKRLKEMTTILMITHNKLEAKELCDYVALISGGKLHEYTSKDQFFKEPKTEIGKEFLESGSAWYFNPEADKKIKDDKLTALRRFSSVNDFYWVKFDLLGGMQRPGLLTDLETDLKIMQQLGVDYLVSLTQKPIDAELLNQNKIKGVHFPIKDMGIPEHEETFQLVSQLSLEINQGKSVVYHCKAGMGRTGTLLACNLIVLDGLSAIKSIDKVRQVNHKYIQTEEQIAFVNSFERHVKHKM
jgi:atypical dual specificity phosphatase